jgi:hypothetical protein
MRIPPTHFNQLAGPKAPKRVEGCDDIWDQDAREDLAWTMDQAEEMIAQELGFWEAPKFITSERLPFALSGVRRDWRNAELQTLWSQIECYGTETLTLKQADAGVLYEDIDNDPFEREERATIGTAIYADLPACDNACEVAVFFRVADGAEDAADPRWEIKPIKVDIDGTTMRITAESSQFALPSLWELTQAECRGSDDPDAWIYNFEVAQLVPAVDVYCRTVNKATPVTLRWDGVCNCPGTCQHSTQLGCAVDRDKRRGFFVPRPATWNGTTNVLATPTQSIAPESVEVNYRAGYPLNTRTCRMNPQLEQAIVSLTNVLLPEPPCGFCDLAERRWKSDRNDVDPLTPEAAAMPWDLYTQGALRAWRIVKKFAQGRGGKMGRGYR